MNITLNGPSADAAELIRTRFVLPHLRDAARVGVAYALVRELSLSQESSSGPVVHNYNVETIDDEGLLADIVNLMRNKQVEDAGGPYHLIEMLMNGGVRALAADIRDGAVADIADLLASLEPERD